MEIALQCVSGSILSSRQTCWTIVFTKYTTTPDRETDKTTERILACSTYVGLSQVTLGSVLGAFQGSDLSVQVDDAGIGSLKLTLKQQVHNVERVQHCKSVIKVDVLQQMNTTPNQYNCAFVILLFN